MLGKTELALALTWGGGAGAITVQGVPALPPGAANPAHDPVYPSGYRLSQLQDARAA